MGLVCERRKYLRGFSMIFDGEMVSFAPVQIKDSHTQRERIHVDMDSFQKMFYNLSIENDARLCALYVENNGFNDILFAILSPWKGSQIWISTDILNKKYPSLTPKFKSASLFERLIAETYGISPEGHPDLRAINLRDGNGNRNIELGIIPAPDFFSPTMPNGAIQAPVGPVHAGIIGPGQFRFHINGEPIEALEILLGYCHRGIENQLTCFAPGRAIHLVERISGDNGVAHGLAYCQALESQTEIPFRAKCIRTVLAELERLHNHFADLGGMAVDVAFVVPAQRFASLREKILRLNQFCTGHRLGWNGIIPGGVRRDFSSEFISNLEKTILSIGFKFEELCQTLVDSPSFVDRAETTGRLSKTIAKELMLVGPSARASGIPYDVRERFPYAIYGQIGMRIPYHCGGDVLARMIVRMEEVRESISIILQTIARLSPDEINTKLLLEPDYEGFSMVESPRGELIHAIHIHEGKVVRHMVKDPSFNNWPALEIAVLGNIVPDFPLINKSFNLSYSGNDL